MITSISIIGEGQVGTSIAAAVAQKAPHISVSMTDVDKTARSLVVQKFHSLGLNSDHIRFTDTAPEAVAGSDLVIIATPLNAMGSVVASIKDSLGVGTIVTDTGSAKAKAIDIITEGLAGTGVPYVPAHPGNGSQGSGPLTASPGNILGANSWMFLIDTPDQKAGISGAHTLVRNFWESAGVQVTQTDAETHDKFFGICSHLEHLLVFSYLNMAQNVHGMKESFAHAGTGFRNLTRIAISQKEPDKPSALVQMWRPIFEQNENPILAGLDNFQDHLDQLSDAVSAGDRKELVKMLAEAHAFRKTVNDPEPREGLKGEIADSKAGLLPHEGGKHAQHIAHNLLIPVAIAYAQTLNARDLNPELVRGKANPSFRDGTALALNDPEELADLLIQHSTAFIQMTASFQAKLDQFGRSIYEGKWEDVKANILAAQIERTPLPGPRKNADTRAEYLLGQQGPA